MSETNTPAVPAKTYTCEACHGVFPFEDGWMDEDAKAEALAIFGTECEGPMSMVCDECWHKLGAAHGFPHDAPEITRG